MPRARTRAPTAHNLMAARTWIRSSSRDRSQVTPPSDPTQVAAQALGTADPLDWEWGDEDVLVWNWQDAKHDPIGEGDT
jgi:hypothetical protein